MRILTQSELKQEAEQLIAAGRMPSLEELLSAMADVREKYRQPILDARHPRSSKRGASRGRRIR